MQKRKNASDKIRDIVSSEKEDNTLYLDEPSSSDNDSMSQDSDDDYKPRNSDNNSISQDDDENNNSDTERNKRKISITAFSKVSAKTAEKISAANTRLKLESLFTEAKDLTLSESSLIIKRARELFGKSPKRRNAIQKKEYSAIKNQVKKFKNAFAAQKSRDNKRAKLSEEKESFNQLATDFESLQQQHAKLTKTIENSSQRSMIELETENQALHEKNIILEKKLETTQQELTHSKNSFKAGNTLLLSENALLKQKLQTAEQMVEQLLTNNSALLENISLLNSQLLQTNPAFPQQVSYIHNPINFNLMAQEQQPQLISSNEATPLQPSIYQEYTPQDSSSLVEQASSFVERPLFHSYTHRQPDNIVAPVQDNHSYEMEDDLGFYEGEASFELEGLNGFSGFRKS